MKKKILLLIAVATLGLTAATMAQVPNYVPMNGLVGYWPFNGNANDESGNANNGTVNGATLTSDRFGNSTSAYDFNGASNISVPSASSLNFQTTNVISVSYWFKTNSNQLCRTPIIQKISGVGNSQIGYDIGLDNGCFSGNRSSQGLMGKNGNASNWVSAVSDTTMNFTNNDWYNIVIVYNNGVGECYVNGILNNVTSSQTGILGANSNLLLFGSTLNPSITSKNYIGQLDDIGIWNRALTQQEITALYNGNICYQTITVTDTLLINMGITGFNPVTFNNTIKIFPNPTNDHITIDYGNFAIMNGYQLKITNSLGQQMFQTNINQQSNYVSLASWGGNGLYFVHIIDPQGNTLDIRKIVLQ